MGIRINKLMGYGLSDLVIDSDDGIIDERINTNSFLVNHEIKTPSLDEYEEYVRSRDNFSLDLGYLRDYKEGKLRRNEWRKPSLTDLAVISWSDSPHKVLCLRPLSCPDWKRHDDPIDYQESSGEDELNMLGLHGLYPWSGSFIRTDTGEQMDHNIMSYIRCYNSDRPVAVALLDNLAQTAGFADHEEAQALLAPIIPDPIIDLCKFAELFVDDKYINCLRPMIYTYWR